MLKRGPDACPFGRVPAAEIEAAVVGQAADHLPHPDTWRATRAERDDITEDEAREAPRPRIGNTTARSRLIGNVPERQAAAPAGAPIEDGLG